MGARPITAAGAIRDAAEVARGAWRRLWGVQGLAAAAAAMVFLSLRAPMPPGLAHDLWGMGWLIGLFAWAPLWTGLHRLALGGAAEARIWPGGLQYGRAELRFLALGLAAALALAFAVLPLIAVSSAIFILFRGLGLVRLGLMGEIRWSFLMVAAVWLLAFAALAYAAARVALAPAATISRRRLVVAEVWRASRPHAVEVLTGWVLAQTPLFLAAAVLAAADPLERAAGFGGSRWPLPDALLAAGVLGLVLAFVHAPLTAGVLGAFYRAMRAERAAAAPPLPRPLRRLGPDLRQLRPRAVYSSLRRGD